MKRIFAMILCAMLLMHGYALATVEIETISWEELPPGSDDQTHVLLLCADKWEAKPWNLGNTDGIMLVTLDTRAHRVMLTSVTRDALVLRLDQTVGKINAVAREGSPEKLCKTLSQHLGVRIEQYILFDFQQIADLIDRLGGVEIEVNAAEIDYLNRYAISKTATDRPLTQPGIYRFNGRAAVIYMRIRKAGGGGDLMRTQRARNVFSSLADQCRNLSYEEASSIANSILEHNIMTSMNLETMMKLVEKACLLRDCTIEELRLPPDELVHIPTDTEIFVQEVDWTACREIFLRYLEHSVLIQEAVGPGQ